MTIKEVLKEDTLLEMVRKIGNRYYVLSHKHPGKKLGKKEGYTSRRAAIAAILGMKSHGGFYNLSPEEKKKRISSYMKNHLNESAMEYSVELRKRDGKFYLYNLLTNKRIGKKFIENLKELPEFAFEYLNNSKWFKEFPKQEQKLILNRFIRRVKSSVREP